MGALCFHHTDSLKVWSYQVLCMIIGELEDAYLAWFVKCVLTTGLSVFIYLKTKNLPYFRTTLIMNFVLILYIVNILILTKYRYNDMLLLYHTDADLYLEYIILLTLIDYKGLLTYVRTNINKFKYRMFKSNRGYSLAYKEVYKGKRWN